VTFPHFIHVPVISLKDEEKHPHITLAIIGPRGGGQHYCSVVIDEAKRLRDELDRQIKLLEPTP